MAELKTELIIAGQMAASLAGSVSQSKRALSSLGTVGTETQKKLAAIGKVNQNQLQLEASCKKYKEALDKVKSAQENLSSSDTKSALSKARLNRKLEEAQSKAAVLHSKVSKLSDSNIRYKQ